MECRIILKHSGASTEVGMFDPETGRYVPLGTHNGRTLETVVRDLKTRMEQAGHTVTFSERSSE